MGPSSYLASSFTNHTCRRPFAAIASSFAVVTAFGTSLGSTAMAITAREREKLASSLPHHWIERSPFSIFVFFLN
jgi:hypothetical protein